MVTFTKFQDILPDPNNRITNTGGSTLWNTLTTYIIGDKVNWGGVGYQCNTGHIGQEPPASNWDTLIESARPGEVGQPFASVKLSQTKRTKQDRTLSGKLINRSNNLGKWQVDIKYNPMTKADFDPVYNFLMQKQGSLLPFHVIIPQNRFSSDPLFKTYTEADPTIIAVADALIAGTHSFEIFGGSDWTIPLYTTTGLPQPGDLFNILDSGDTLHTKAYKITHIEDQNIYETVPFTATIRIHFTPALARDVNISSYLVFNDPTIRVVQKQDIQEYKLNTENLYSFSLRLEEALY